MRFGMSGTFLPSNMDDFTPEIAQEGQIIRIFGCVHPFSGEQSL